jgi:hypothetical protein
MIEIGKIFLWAVSNAKQIAHQKKEQHKLWAQQAQEQADALAQDYEQKMAYLFRSSAEKTALAYENARRQLAALQAKRAANGLTGESASALDEKQTTALQQAQEQQRMQQTLQVTAAQQNNLFQQQWRALRTLVARYSRAAKRKGRLGSFGKAITALFK